ncbi:MAG TPA: hypothetical protein ENN43_04875 [bacterium]|nr:hypothetical protein [bacterium]
MPAEETDDAAEFYRSLTASAGFNYRPAFVDVGYTKNRLFEDIKTTAVESVPFGFLLTFAGIYIWEAAGQGWELRPKLGTIEDYKHVYAVSVGAFAALNVLLNTLFYYEYKDDGGGVK